MAIQKIPQVSCSLNLGMIYNLDYSYDPSSGVKIKIYFVNEQGRYIMPNLLPLRKEYIRIGATSFTMYPVQAQIEYASGRRIIWVEFEDEFIFLNHYYVALPNRGCGKNVFTLGSPAYDPPSGDTPFEPVSKDAQTIERLTKFPDYVYTFNDFIAVLRTKFNVQFINAPQINNSNYKRDFEGSFASVLTEWCGIYNLSFFFENGIIKIFDPTNLIINLPVQQSDMLTYEYSESVKDTYGKNVSSWFQQEGGQISLTEANNSSGPNYIRTETLFPIDNDTGQTQMDLSQVAAAQFGKEFWFVYNYWKGTISEICSWQPYIGNPGSLASSITQNIRSSLGVDNAQLVMLNPDDMDLRFNAYYNYGQQIAGKYYMSEAKNEIVTDQTFQWFDESQGSILKFNEDGIQDKSINITYLTPVGANNTNIVNGTNINKYYQGIRYDGNRMLYQLNTEIPTGVFTLNSTLQGIVNYTFEQLYSIAGSTSMDFSSISPQMIYAAAAPLSLDGDLIKTFQNVSTLANQYLKPKYSSLPIKGITFGDFNTVQQSKKENQEVKIVSNTEGPNVVGNVSILKTVQNGSYTAYYEKYATCKNSATDDIYYNYYFEPMQVSQDTDVGITVKKTQNNTYNISRDFGFVNQYINQPFLAQIAQPRTFTTKSVTYTKNYFEEFPLNFLSNGLVSMSLSISDTALFTSYTYSNQILAIRDRKEDYMNRQQTMKNSWMQKYSPNRNKIL